VRNRVSKRCKCQIQVAKNYGHKVDGVEPSDFWRELAENAFNIELYKNLEEIEQNKKYDAILLYDIIEHVTNPKDFIGEVGKKLSENGILVLLTPNSGDFFVQYI